jgi:hypothetical protein
MEHQHGKQVQQLQGSANLMLSMVQRQQQQLLLGTAGAYARLASE